MMGCGHTWWLLQLCKHTILTINPLFMLIIMLINAHKHTILTIHHLFMLFIVIVVAVTVVLATIFVREWDLEQIFKFPQSADTSLYLRILCAMRV